MEEELEFLCAVYGGDLTLLDTDTDDTRKILAYLSKKESFVPSPFSSACYSPENISRVIHFMARPRGESTSTSFVEASFYFLLPSSYPSSSEPIVYLDRLSGLTDDGKSLQHQIHDFLSARRSQEDECGVLYHLIEGILDVLDQSNNGECQICFQSLLSENERRKNTFSSSNPTVTSLRTHCYHCFHISCLCRWACEYFDQSNDQKAKVSSEQQNLSIRSFQGEVKTSETHLKRSQDEFDLLQQHISEIQSKIQRFGGTAAGMAAGGSATTPSPPVTVAGLDELRHQFTQLNVQITKASGKKKQKLFDSANKLKLQIQTEERRQQNGAGSDPLTENGEEWADNDMTLPQLEGELRRLQSQVPEAENKVRRGKSRLESSVADLNSEIKKQEMKSQEEASNWSRTPFPCPCCRSPLIDCLPSDPSYFQKCLEEAYHSLQNSNSSSNETDPTDNSRTVTSLPKELQEYVRKVQKDQLVLKTRLNSWIEVERSLSTAIPDHSSATLAAVAEEEMISPTVLVSSGAHQRVSREGQKRAEPAVATSDGDRKASNHKMGRLQDRRFDQQRDSKPEANPFLVSDLIAKDLLPSESYSLSSDHDPLFQEAIRLSLLESSSLSTSSASASASASATDLSLTSAHLKKATGAAAAPAPAQGKSANQKGKQRNERGTQGQGSLKKFSSQKEESNRKPAAAPSPSHVIQASPPTLPFIEQEQEQQRCLICDELFDSEEHLYAFGSCDHASICGICAFRSRCILHQDHCVMCRAPLDAMICSETPPDPSNPSTTFQQLYQQTQQQKQRQQQQRQVVASKGKSNTTSSKSKGPEREPSPELPSPSVKGKLVYHEESKMYVPRLYLKETLLRLMCFRCTTCGEIFDSNISLRSLKQHLQSHDLFLCEICYTERKIFPSEMNVYTSQQLQSHFQSGDAHLGTKGHPLCSLCGGDRRFYDQDQLQRHMIDDHHQCYLCRDNENEEDSRRGAGATGAGEGPGSYFKNAHELQEHFKKCHFLCKQCRKLRVTSVFRTELALTEHIERSHLVLGNRYR